MATPQPGPPEATGYSSVQTRLALSQRQLEANLAQTFTGEPNMRRARDDEPTQLVSGIGWDGGEGWDGEQTSQHPSARSVGAAPVARGAMASHPPAHASSHPKIPDARSTTRIHASAPQSPPSMQATAVNVVSTHSTPPEHEDRLIFIHEGDSDRAASFRVLRQRLRENGDPRTIVVSSPNAQEGKTTAAINLAMALAEHGRSRVLLIEGNTRTPCLAEVMGFEVQHCFANQMAAHRENPLEPWNVVAAFFPNLHVLAMGSDVKGRWLLNGPAFAMAIEQLRGSGGYDYLVVDAPSALGSADVNVIEDSADGVLLVARARVTPLSALRLAAEQLAPANILGTVLMELAQLLRPG